MSIKAYILVTLEPAKTRAALEGITSKVGVKRCFLVTGRYDAIVEVEAEGVKELSDMTLSGIRCVNGVRRTETLVVYE